MLGSDAEVAQFAAEVSWRVLDWRYVTDDSWMTLPDVTSHCSVQHGWEVANGRISFAPAASKDATAATAALPTLDIINQCLNYAREVERIV